MTEIQKANLLSRYPELMELYGEAQADSAIRSSPHWEAWQGRMDNEREMYQKRMDEITQQLLRGEIDTREYREKVGEAGQNYGAILEAIERDPNYAEIYDYFAKKDSQDPVKAKDAIWRAKDASRARGWAERIRKQMQAGIAAAPDPFALGNDQPSREFDDADIPF